MGAGGMRVCALAALIAGWGASGAEAETTDAVATDLQAYVETSTALLAPSAAAVVVSRGDQVLHEAYWPGDMTGLPAARIDTASLWALASGTKSYGAAVLLCLVHQGVVGLDDPVSSYLPSFAAAGGGPFPRTAVTLRHLASHTSGLGFPEGTEWGPPDSAVVLTEPGVDFRYSWLGVHMLERALEAATGRDYEALLQDEILTPLGLTGTRFVYEVDPDLPLLPCRVGDFDDPLEHYPTVEPGSRISHGLYATARDVNRFGRLWAHGGTVAGRTYFTPELVAEAFRHHGTRASDNGGYGLLWWLFPDDGGAVMSGATHMASAVVPDVDVVVTVMRNHWGAIPAEFSFYDDKQALVRFGRRFAEAAAIAP